VPGFGYASGSDNPVRFSVWQKTLRHRVILAIAFATHAAQETVRRQQSMILLAGVLAAAVRVMQQAVRRLAILQRHLKRVQREPTFQSFAQG
jgi:hypothetical protein